MLKYLLMLGIILSINTALNAQVSEGGLPVGLRKVSTANTAPFSYAAPVYTISKPNVVSAKIQDASNDSKGAYRVGLNVPVSITMSNSGNWTLLPDGTKVWRLTISGRDALALGLYFSEAVQIPAGGKLFAYNKNGRQVLGAYTSATDDFQAMEMVQGEQLYLEYSAPSWVQELPVFSISEVVYFYRGVEEHVNAFIEHELVQDKATSCEVDVACSEGNSWANQIKSVVHYTFNDGSSTYVCSAATINNTSNNCKPYILTAWHCGERVAGQSIATWVWYWKYQKTTCAPGNANYNDPSKGSKTMTGGTVRASSGNGTLNNPPDQDEVAGSDFYLVELNSQPPASYDAYYAGWDRTNTASSSGVGIHHPAGSAKKISTYTQTLTSDAFNYGASNAHWKVFWAATSNGHGVTEGGSSGSPIFNSSGRIVGQLSGGASACYTNGAGQGTGPDKYDLYGKLYFDWDQNGSAANAQLKPWLDPTNTGVTYVAGTAAPCVTVNAPVAQFTANPTTLSVGGTSQFTDQSTGTPTSWAWVITPASGWSYTGGTNANSQNPQINFTAGGTYTVQLTVSNSAGSDAELKTNYIYVTTATSPCSATSIYCDEFIQKVVLEGINNETGCTNYTSYNQSATLIKSQSYAITIIPQITGDQPGSAYTGDEIAAWIDFNGDFDFDDPGERIAFVSIVAGSSLVFNFTVPSSAATGIVKMRVRITFNPSQGGEGPVAPCGITNYGEVEDYNIVLSNPLGLEQNYLEAVSIYPNPAFDEVHIDFSGIESTDLSLELQDMTGKVIQVQPHVSGSKSIFDLSSVAKGSYQVRISDGTIQRIVRIVKL